MSSFGGVYAYQAALWCASCAKEIIANKTAAGEAPEDPDNEETFDSDDFPKGPYFEGEADNPQYCDGCGEFLENDLTADGVTYVKERIEEALIAGNRASIAITEWLPFYDPDLSPKAIRFGRMSERVRVLADETDGTLPKYADGGYPMYYVTGEHGSDVCCPACANDPDTGLAAFGWTDDLIVDYDANYENTELYCECGERIPSAYAEDDVKEEEVSE